MPTANAFSYTKIGLTRFSVPLRLEPRNTAELTAKRAAEDAAREQKRADRQASFEAKAAELVRAKVPPVIQAPAVEAPAPDRDPMTTAAPAPIHPRQEQHRRDVAALLEPTPPAAPAVEAPAQTPKRSTLHSRDFGTIPKAPQPKAPERTAEQVYADLLQPILARHQAAAAAAIETLRADRERWSQVSEAHQAAKPGMVRLPGSLPKWERAGEALEQERRGFYGREMDLQTVTPHTIERAAVAALRRANPAVVEAAETAYRERKEQEKKKLQAQIDKANQERTAKELARDKANVGKDFKSLAVGRESRAHGYTDRADKWRSMAPELKEKIEAYIKLPKEQRPAELERIHADPRVLKLLQEHREQSRTQGRGSYGD